jgi:erythromycin esterase-like protein
MVHRNFIAGGIEITKQLIMHHNFSFIAVEGGYKVNCYVKGIPFATAADSAYDVLYSFNRWPTWNNKEMVGFVEWLRVYVTSPRPPFGESALRPSTVFDRSADGIGTG